VGKNKLSKWAEMRTFGNVIEPDTSAVKKDHHPLRGNWKKEIFRNDHPLVLELGCGKGEYTVGLALKYPDKNHLGVDIKGARIWRGAKTAYEEKIINVFFVRTRIEFISSFFTDDEADEIWITFPDPFPKPADAGRRLTSPHFLNSYRKILRDKGIVHLKTDNSVLYKYTRDLVHLNQMEVIADTDDLYGSGSFNEILAIRTHYESLFLKDGIKIKYIAFRLEKDKVIRDAYTKE